MKSDTIRLQNITLKLIKNEEGHERWCVNISAASKLIGTSPVTVSTYVKKGELTPWYTIKNSSQTSHWLPIETIVDMSPSTNIPADLAILMKLNVLHIDQYKQEIKQLLKIGKIKWDDLAESVRNDILS